MAENLDLNIKVNTSGVDGSLGSLKKQLREAQADVVKLSEKFGATSVQAAAAAKKASELKDKIGDAKALTDAFNPDAKFKSLTASLSGVAGGFGAVQGAMALFGVESDEVQKTLLKVQSAMAISQGLQAVGESIDSFKNLGAVIKNTSLFQSAYNFILGKEAIAVTGNIIATKAKTVATEAQTVATVEQGVATVTTTTAVGAATLAMKALRIALIASGIGILILAIGFAVEAFLKFSGAAEKAAAAQKKLNERIAEGAKIQLEAEEKFIDNQEKLDIARLKAKGASEQKIFELEQSYRRQKIASLQRHYEEVYGKDTKAAKDTLDEINKINVEGQVAELENREKIRKEKEIADKKEVERNEASIKEQADFELKLQQDLLKLDEDNAAKKRAIEFQKNEDLISDLDYKNELLDTDFEEDRQRLANKEAYIADQKYIELSNLKLTEIERLEIISKYAKMERDIDKEITKSKKDEKKAQVKDTMQLMSDLSSFVNKDTVAGKTLAIATATINTYQGASEALKQKSTLPSPFDVIAKIANVAAIIGTGIKTVKSIASVQVPNGGGGGVPSISTEAPIFPQLPSATTTNLSQQSINDIGNQAVRAYVIESDVTSNQQRITAIRQRARFS